MEGHLPVSVCRRVEVVEEALGEAEGADVLLLHGGHHRDGRRRLGR